MNSNESRDQLINTTVFVQYIFPIPLEIPQTVQELTTWLGCVVVVNVMQTCTWGKYFLLTEKTEIYIYTTYMYTMHVGQDTISIRMYVRTS